MSIQEFTRRFREFAEETKFPMVKEKLLSLANDLASLPAGSKIDVENLSKDLENLQIKMETCAEAEAAQGFCIPFILKLGKVIEEVKAWK